MKTFKRKAQLSKNNMKRSSLMINYCAQFLLLLSLFFDAGKTLQVIKLTLLVIITYLLYKQTVKSFSKDELKTYNLLYVATNFIFAIYFAGYTYKLHYHILLGMMIAAYLGLFSSFFYAEKFVLVRKSKKPIKIVNFDVKNKDQTKEIDQILKEAKALMNAEKELKTASKRRTAKKTVKKVAKKKAVKKSPAKKKVAKKKSVKKVAKKKPVKKTKSKKN